MSDIVLGIDLGTTNSVVAISDGSEVRVLVDDGGSRLIPSVVSFHPDSRILVGVEARERRLVDAANTIYSVKRLIGRPYRTTEVEEAQRRFAFKLKESANGGVLVAIRNDTFTLTEISAFVLREVRRIAETALGRPVNKAVVTVPAAFDELQRSATKAAGRVAGLEVLRIVNEPTAAALAYGVGRDRKERVAVYDLGGGTFDLTLLELENEVFEVLGSAGDSFLGGDDVDAAVSEVLATRFLEQHRVDPRADEQAFERIRAAAEWLKCTLSTETVATATIEALAMGARGQPIDLSHTMTRDELDGLMRPFVVRSLEVCGRALADANVRASDLDSVILVGGATRIPLVRKMVEDFFALSPRGEIDPDLVVAQGAAIHGYALAKKKPEKGIGRVALKRMTVAELEAVRTARAEQRAAGPKQVAFAPTNQIELPKPPPPKVALGRRPVIEVGSAIASAKTPLAVPAAPPKRAPSGSALVPPEPKKAPVGPKIALGTKQSRDLAFPTLPKPKPRISTVPPPAAHPIEAGSDGRLTLDDAFAPAKVSVPRTGGSSASTPRPRLDGTLLALDGAFGSKSELELAASTLETAVERASHRPPAPAESRSWRPSSSPLLAPLLPVVAGTEDAIVELDDDEFELSASIPPSRSALAGSFAARPAAFLAAAPSTLPEAIGSDEFEYEEAVEEIETAPEEFDFGEPEEMPSLELVEDAGTLVLPERSAPILMDVTPLSLGVETVGGYCQAVIRRNAPIPCEQSRSFTTASDRQSVVTIRVCQGESRMVAENQLLGVIELTGLRPAARGSVRIAVTFEIDASGILDVKAVDEDTNETQRTRIRLLGGADDAEIEAMKARQAKLVGATT